eukprot:XP_011675634.1 PREDICTED: uncharacterized protein LOC105443760 [Strongylocentrotus purpuratus]
MEYEVAFCYIFSQYVMEQLGSTLYSTNCVVLSFRQGSVVGDVQVELAAKSQSVADGLAVSLYALSTNIDQNLSANGQTLVASIFIGNADPCTQRNPCVNGVCRPIGQGQYECECKDHYEGIHCDEPTRKSYV